MKIEQLIVQHLYNSKKVTLQDIGTFILSPEIAMPLENEKDFTMPANAIIFERNKKAVQDEELISFIVAQTRKIRPLATSDLESYSILANQFLNIGKPFLIEGLGVLQKNQAGDYEFTLGNYINAKLDAAPALLKEKTDEDISFSTTGKPATSNKKLLPILLLLIIAAAAFALFYYLKKGSNDNSVEKVLPVITDTIVKPKDSVATVPAPLKPDSATITTPAIKDSSFKFVLREFNSKDAADKYMLKLKSYGHEVIIYSTDSLLYKVSMQFRLPLTDTMHIRDSLKLFFGGNPYVEKH